MSRPAAAKVLIAHLGKYGASALGQPLTATVDDLGGGSFAIHLIGIANDVGGPHGISNPSNEILGQMTDGHFFITKITSTVAPRGQILMIRRGEAVSASTTDVRPL